MILLPIKQEHTTQNKAKVLWTYRTVTSISMQFKFSFYSYTRFVCWHGFFSHCMTFIKISSFNYSLHLSHFIWSSKAPGNSEIIMKAASHWCSSKECWKQEALFLEGTVLTAHLVLLGCRLLVLHYLTRMFCCVMMAMLTDVGPLNETLSLLFCQSFIWFW